MKFMKYKEKKKVSVIIPVYNVENYIEECIKSVLTQNYDNYEIILLDDGSTDNSLEICKKFEDDIKIKIIHNQNHGVSITRNEGINIANGEYIIFIDSDDCISYTFIEDLVEAIEKNDADIAICGYTRNRLELNKDEGNDISIIQADDYLNMLFKNNLSECYVWNKIFKRNIIINSNIYFPECISIWEDMYFLINYLNNINKVAIINKKLYFYRIRMESTINNSDTTSKIEEKILILKLIKENCRGKISVEEQKILEKKYISSLLRYLMKCNKEKNIYQKKEILKKIKNSESFMFLNRKEKIKYYYLKFSYKFKG